MTEPLAKVIQLFPPLPPPVVDPETIEDVLTDAVQDNVHAAIGELTELFSATTVAEFMDMMLVVKMRVEALPGEPDG